MILDYGAEMKFSDRKSVILEIICRVGFVNSLSKDVCSLSNLFVKLIKK